MESKSAMFSHRFRIHTSAISALFIASIASLYFVHGCHAPSNEIAAQCEEIVFTSDLGPKKLHPSSETIMEECEATISGSAKPVPSFDKVNIIPAILGSLNLSEAPDIFNIGNIPKDHYVVRGFLNYIRTPERTDSDCIAIFPTKANKTERSLKLSFQLDHLPERIRKSDIEGVRLYFYNSGTEDMEYFIQISSPTLTARGNIPRNQWRFASIDHAFLKRNIPSDEEIEIIIERGKGKSCGGNKFTISANKNQIPYIMFLAKSVTTSQGCLVDDSNSMSCSKQSKSVNFAGYGWDNWLVYPQNYEHTYCDGSCDNSFRNNRSCLPYTVPTFFVYWQKYALIGHTIPDMLVEKCDCMWRVNNDPAFNSMCNQFKS